MFSVYIIIVKNIMDETQRQKSLPIAIQPRYVFGLQTNIKGNIHFTAKQEVIYPVAGVLAFQDVTTNKQKFLRFPEGCVLEIIDMSPNRKLLAIAERIGDKSFVTIYDLPSNKKRRTIFLPADLPNTDVSCITFTYDNKGIVILSKEPDAFIALFYFDKAETVITGRVSNRNQKGLAKMLAPNPSDSGMVAIGGDFTFKLMNKTEKGMVLLTQIKTEHIIVTTMAWLSGDIVVAGTSGGELLVVESGEPKTKFSACDVEVIDFANISGDEAENTHFEYDIATPPHFQGFDVLNLVTFPKGFTFSIHNAVHIFEKTSSYKFIKKTLINIPMDLYADKLYKITNIAINMQQDTIIVTTLHPQIYIGMVFVPETMKIKQLEFRTLGEPLHIDGVVSMSICSWKPIIMTAGKDQTVRIWNYETGTVELVKKYMVDVSVTGLHPSGILAAVGFSDQLRLMEILLDDLKVAKTFNFPKCTNVEFSHQGHLLVASYEYLIVIIAVFSFEVLRTLKGHNGIINGLVWSMSDETIFSVGADGAVYEWETKTGERVNEIVHKGIEYRAAVVSSDRGSIYTVTNQGTISEIANSTVLREIHIPDTNVPLKCLTIARSDLVMFAGTEKGHLYNVKVPFMEAGGGLCSNTRFFHSAITKMCITYDDLLLATASDDGTLVFWSIVNNEGRIAPMDQDLLKCKDVMISRTDLIEKIEMVLTLELRIDQQKTEFLFAREQGDNFHSEQIKEIHSGYCDAIENLKQKNVEMEEAHREEFNEIAMNIAKTKEANDQSRLDLETEFHDKIIIEYEKSTAIKKTMDEMREDYEQKLRKSAGCLQDTIEALELDFRKQLHERQELIRQLTKEIETKKVEFMEYCRQVEADSDRRIVQSQLNYENLLKDEHEKCLNWSGEAGVLQKKFTTISKENAILREEIRKLKNGHEKQQQKIFAYEKDMEVLKREIEDRDVTIHDREKKGQEMIKKTQELEKYKQVLKHQINELKAEIEPREREIKERKLQIVDMERELEQLQLNNQKLQLHLSELKDKFHGTNVELRTERDRNKTARAQVTKISSDIHNVSENIQRPNQLKVEVSNLYQRYADDKKLKKTLSLDAEVQNEFLRQRRNLEKLVTDRKIKGGAKNQQENKEMTKLLYENVTLIEELNRIRKELHDYQKNAAKLDSLMGLNSKSISTSAAKSAIAKAVKSHDEIEEEHNREIAKLQDTINKLSEVNDFLRNEIRN